MNLDNLANYYGYDLVDYTDHPSYRDRAGKVFALVDRRDGKVACIYATKQQVKKYLEKFSIKQP